MPARRLSLLEVKIVEALGGDSIARRTGSAAGPSPKMLERALENTYALAELYRVLRRTERLEFNADLRIRQAIIEKHRSVGRTIVKDS